jgi:hypothetical protein
MLLHDMMLLGGGIGPITIVGDPTFAVNTTTATLPSDLEPGDIVLCFAGSDSIADGSLTPSGYTEITASVSNLLYFRISYKIMGSPVDTTATVTFPSTDRGYAFVAVRNVDNSNVLDGTPARTWLDIGVDAEENAKNGETITPANVTTSFAKSAVFVYGILDDDITSTTGPTGYTEIFDTTVGSSGLGFTHAAYIKIKDDPGLESFSSNVTFLTSDTIRSATFALRNV